MRGSFVSRGETLGKVVWAASINHTGEWRFVKRFGKLRGIKPHSLFNLSSRFSYICIITTTPMNNR